MLSSSSPKNIRTLRKLESFSWFTSLQLGKLSNSLTTSRIERHGIIFDEVGPSGSTHVLLSGVARITCRNRKDDRTLVTMVAPGMIPTLPPPVSGIRYDFRCEAVTNCQTGIVDSDALIQIALGITLAQFKRMAGMYSGRWDLVQLRCANFMSFTLEERLALILLELSAKFGVSEEEGVVIIAPLRHKDLAELAGASRPRITEQLARLERKQLIVRDARRLIARPDRLERFLSGKKTAS